MIDNFVNKVKIALQEYGVDNERLTVENLNQILDQFRNELNAQLWTVENVHQGPAVPVEHVETGQRYTVHFIQVDFISFQWIGISHDVVFLTYGDNGGLVIK